MFTISYTSAGEKDGWSVRLRPTTQPAFLHIARASYCSRRRSFPRFYFRSNSSCRSRAWL
jgi:hypothetical protein